MENDEETIYKNTTIFLLMAYNYRKINYEVMTDTANCYGTIPECARRSMFSQLGR